MEYKGFIHGSYQSQAITADQERTVNWYPERMESEGATTRWALYPTPGVEILFDGVYARGRGHFSAQNREFAVIGEGFYEVPRSGSPVAIGAVASDQYPATISFNGDGGGELFITSGGNGYIFNLGSGSLTQITALNGKASMGGHLDGYFLALDRNTSTLYISGLLDGLTWATGTDFAQRSKAADPWISMRVNSQYIWLLGTETSEVWYDTGASFPFAPHPSGLIPWGCAAAFSVAQVGAALVWLGTSIAGGISVLQASGFTPEVVSDYPQQLAMSGYGHIADAEADSYSDLGHTFYLLSFPTADVTWAWDSTTGQWTERATWLEELGRYGVWRPRWHTYIFDEHRWLDAKAGSVYRTTIDSMLDVSKADVGFPDTRRSIRRLRRAPALMSENERVFYSAFELDVEIGLGLENGQGSDPRVMLRMSDDGGKTWSPEIWRSAGKIGEYGTRVRWERLGQARRRVFEVSVTDPIPWRLTNAYLALAQPPKRQGISMQASR